jgi:5'(3')-deoxyribonucleotidase
MRGIVAFDLDEVILNLRDGILAALRRRQPGYLHWREWSHFHHNQDQGISNEEFLNIIVEESILEQAPIEPGAREAIEAIRSMGYETAVVTARGYHPRGESVTRRWLANERVVMDYVRVVPFGISKTETLRELGGVVAYVDDHHKHLEALHAAGVGGELVLLNRPWNQSASGFWRVGGLPGFADVVRRLATVAA